MSEHDKSKLYLDEFHNLGNEIDLMGDIAKRADEMNLLMFDRMSLIMDLEVATREFNLRLEELLNADNFNFSHDVVGIQQNIDRENVKMNGVFVPRFASP